MTTDINAQIAQHERLIAHLRAELEKLRTQIVLQTTDMLADWYFSRAREIVSRDPEVAKTLGPDALQTLKRDVAKLAAEAKSSVPRALSPPEFWWHLQDPPPLYGEYGTLNDIAKRYLIQNLRLPPALAGPLTELMNKLGPILEARGFLKGTDWRQAATHCVSWPEDTQLATAEYARKSAVAVHLLIDLDRLRIERTRGSVGDLWDSL